MFLNPDNESRRSLPLILLAGIFAIASGIIVIAGWVFHIEILKSVFPGLATMKFNTALCFILAGAALILLVKKSNLFSKILFTALTIVLGIFSAITFSQLFFNWNAGIDQFFVKDYFTIAHHFGYPGRMSLATALCFMLLAISFFGINAKLIFYKKAAQYILHFVTLLAFVSITGYIFKVPYSLKFSSLASMAINTAVVFFALSLAASAINYNIGITSLFTGTGIGNIIARRLFPRVLVLLVFLGYVSIELQRAGYLNPESGVILSTLVFLVICLFFIRNTLTEMNRIDLKRTEAENETRLLNKNLEDIVMQRTLALKTSNERFLKIFNSNPTCIAITNLQTGEYADVNPAIINLLGYSREEIIGHTAAELGVISAGYRQQMVNSLATQGFIKNQDIILNDKYKNDKHCILSAELLEDENGKYMMSFVYDITERKIIENKLKDNKEKLEVLSDKLSRQNKQLTSFAHIISHNLRSPVSNLNLLVHFYNESVTEEDRLELWKNFETVIGHLNNTFDELLETLKIQDDTTKERENLSFEKIVNGVQQILVGQIKESKAVIKTDFSKAPQVLYPKIYLESIMLNLVSNALKYKSPNRAPEINICTDDVDGQIILTVADNGLGIDLTRHAKSLFGLRKTFHRHAEAKGLGLFMTKTQIEAMGGEITAESVVDKGTKFKVVFNKT